MFMKKFRLDGIWLFLLLSLSWYAWRLLPQGILRGNGFMYMLPSVQKWFWGRPFTLTGFEVAAAISGAVFRKFFGANMGLYLWSELFVILTIGVCFYAVVRILTKHRLVAFAASLIFTVNYFGNFDMLVAACYCYPMERVFNVPLLLLSFIFLLLFLERTRRGYYLVSLFLYFLGVGLGHFSFFFAAPFLFFPFFWYVYNKKGKMIRRGALIGISYAAIIVFFVLVQQINESGLGPTWSLWEFFLHPQKYHYIESIIAELTYWSQYPPIFFPFIQRVIFHYQTNRLLHTFLTAPNAREISPYVFCTYIIATTVIYKKLFQQRAMLLTIICSTVIIFFLNAYFGQYLIANQSGSNRYLYFSTFLLAIFWSFFLWAVFWQKGSRIAIWGIVVLLGYYFINEALLSDNFREVHEWNESTKIVLGYIVHARPYLTSNTLVIGPHPEIGTQESEFLTEQIGKGGVVYLSESEDVNTLKEIASKSAQVIKLRYDKKCRCVHEEKIK